MWQAIRTNQRRSRLLIALMALVLLGLGYLIGLTVDPRLNGPNGLAGLGGPIGALAALLVYVVMLASALLAGNQILLSAAGAHPIQKADAPRLWNVVEEMTLAAGLPAMPAVYLIDEDSPNAFAVGRRPEKAAVAVTSGLLKRLTRDELQGVIAHEIGHIKNEDTRFLTLASVMVGAISLLSEIFLRSLRFRGSSRRSSREGGGQIELVIFLITIVAAIVAPLFAQLLYFACSRRREFLADASAARFTRYPAGLAAALEKIGGAGSQNFACASRIVAPLFIVNPLRSFPEINLLSTHPPTETRVKILRAMGGRAGLSDYETAFQTVQGGKGEALGSLTLGQADSLAARAANSEPEPAEDAVGRRRETANLLGRLGQYLDIPCACGLSIKVPPGYRAAAIACPRCGASHAIPKAQPNPRPAPAAPETPAAPASRKAPAMLYARRQGGRWESFRCDCGQTIQLSPGLLATSVQCPKCKRKIEITHETYSIV